MYVHGLQFKVKTVDQNLDVEVSKFTLVQRIFFASPSAPPSSLYLYLLKRSYIARNMEQENIIIRVKELYNFPIIRHIYISTFFLYCSTYSLMLVV